MDWDKISDRFSLVGETMGKGLKRLFGSQNERVVRSLEPTIKKIAELEPWAEALDQDAIRAKMAEFKAAVGDGSKTLDDLMPEVFALVREASRRTLGLRHFDVQMVGGWAMHTGSIAEMATGEGKTLVATLALSLNALSGRPTYLVTVNDYLARRDANWMRPVYEYLGLSVGSIQSNMSPWERAPVYASDIIYGTNNEFGFDYLRDNMKTSLDQQVQKDLYFAIVDEVDSILIDEARTPLIISGPAEEHIGKYQRADEIVRQLVREEHYEVKEKERSASLTEAGIIRAEEIVGVDSFYTPGNEDWPHYIENAIRAHELYSLDKEYVVENGEVVIVDEFTGRKMSGRRWSDGLHQAVEVKQGLEPKQETQTLATITFQNYFRMFEKLAGMTGTAITEAGEFHKIYGLDVVSIPTNLPIARDDGNDVVYRTEPEKWNAICDEIERVHEKGQPCLVGTASVENSEHLSKLLHERKIPHEVLNAKNHEREAQIVARAGERAAVTVATNMAGRGTDIKLGGNFEYRLGNALEQAGLVEGDVDHLQEIDEIRQAVLARCEKDEAEVQSLGGLYVLGTERHEARRIDNQLRGRSGRQGNAGESRFYLSLQDPLMRIFYRDWVTNAMEKLGMSEGQEIESGMVTRAIGRAQKKVEDRNFEIRKNLLEYDEVMDQQRKTIYGVRQSVLEGSGLEERVGDMLDSVTRRFARIYSDDAPGYKEWLLRTYGFEVDDAAVAAAVHKDEPDVEGVVEAVQERYQARREELGDFMERVEQYVLLNAIDGKWKDHLHAVDSLKQGIGLRGYAQQDPKIAYKKEGTELFHDHLLPAIEDEVASMILRLQVATPEERAARAAQAKDAADASARGALTPRGMGTGVAGAPAQPTPEQIAAYRKRQREAQARQVMRPQVSATNAFDLMKRRKAAAEQRAAAESAQGATGEGQSPAPGADPEPSAPAAKTGPASSARTRTQAAPAPARSAQPDPAFEGAGRNDPCPCGSGKKFKKCHG